MKMEQGSTRNKIVRSDRNNSKNRIWRNRGTALHLHKAIVMIKHGGVYVVLLDLECPQIKQSLWLSKTGGCSYCVKLV